MNDTFFIIFILSLIAANIVVFTCIFACCKRDKEDVRTILKASEDMITGIDSFRNDIPKMSEEFVSEIRPAIDSYIRERVEAYLVGPDTSPQPVGEVSLSDVELVSDDTCQTASNDSPFQDMPLTNGLSFEDIEIVNKKNLMEYTYKKIFLRIPENMFLSSTGKQVPIREE